MTQLRKVIPNPKYLASFKSRLTYIYQTIKLLQDVGCITKVKNISFKMSDINHNPTKSFLSESVLPETTAVSLSKLKESHVDFVLTNHHK